MGSRGMWITAIIAATLVAILVGLYLMNRFVWFYRDPVRSPQKTGRVIISPADGQIVYIKRFDEAGEISAEKLGRRIKLTELTGLPLEGRGEGWIIGIYMSPFDVHYNYAPVRGKVDRIVSTKARANVPMVDLAEYIRISFLRRAFDNFADRFHLDNERNSLLIQGEFPVAVVEIADRFVNKISCFVSEGDSVEPGTKIGFIDRGSQVDLIIFKHDIDVKVEFGEQVYGGATVIAEY